MSQAVLLKMLAGFITIGGTISVIALNKALNKVLVEEQIEDVVKETSQTVTSSMLEVMYLGVAALLYLAGRK